MSLNAALAELGRFDTVIDVRSPAEYADDHIPGAINCPVLDDAQRARVGTLYKQASPFVARKLGAVLVARNIADHIEARFAEQPKEWTPLVYCWRGGQRSGAFTHVLREIGWSARRLEGGYKTWRRHVLEQLESLPGGFAFRVIAGPTGSGKSRVLEALAAQGAQVLHLERLAAHKGSVLGPLPSQAQPSQKAFESALALDLQRFDPNQPVYVESESRRIGMVHLPGSLIDAIRRAPCHVIEASTAARVRFLLDDYAYATVDPAWLKARLRLLREIQGHETVAQWEALIAAGDYARLVEELLARHYDPLYRRSQAENYKRAASAAPLQCDDLAPAAIESLASAILSTPGG